MPQAPQLLGSVASCASQPSRGLLSLQSLNPALQVCTQAPAWQVGVEFGAEQQSPSVVHTSVSSEHCGSSKSTPTLARPLRRMGIVTGATALAESVAVMGPPTQEAVWLPALGHALSKASAVNRTLPSGKPFSPNCECCPVRTGKSLTTTRLPAAVTRIHCTPAGTSSSV